MRSFLLDIFIVLGYVSSLEVIMDRAELLELNPTYVEWGKIFVTRFGRKSPYYLNIEGKTHHQWNNNMTVNIVFYEYLHNEYRRTFVEIHRKYCDLLEMEFMGPMLTGTGITCPLPTGAHHLMNMTVDMTSFSMRWPFVKCRADVYFTVTDTETVIARAWLYMKFTASLKKGKTNKE